MNGLAVTEPAATSLLDAVEDSLISARAGHSERCLWCGAADVRVTAVDIWSGSVSVRCPSCGSELAGTVKYHAGEARR